ncbi:hypothetical protein ABT218_35170, partial [Streptomyces sp. NPDC001455]
MTYGGHGDGAAAKEARMARERTEHTEETEHTERTEDEKHIDEAERTEEAERTGRDDRSRPAGRGGGTRSVRGDHGPVRYGPPAPDPGLPVLPELAEVLAAAAGRSAPDPTGGGDVLRRAATPDW